MRILDVNQACCDITGYSWEESLGELVTGIFSADPVQGDLRDILEQAGSNGSWRGEYDAKNGERIPSGFPRAP